MTDLQKAMIEHARKGTRFPGEVLQAINGREILPVGTRVKVAADPPMPVTYSSGFPVQVGTVGRVAKMDSHPSGLINYVVKTKDGCKFSCPGMALEVPR